jgi:gluconokinase
MREALRVLAIDIGSGGVTAARLDATLAPGRLSETPWTLRPDARGSATLSMECIREEVEATVRQASGNLGPPEAIVLASMMHTLVVTGPDHVPRTPLFTWLDRDTLSDAAPMRSMLGDDYTRRTGAWFHPSFPAYKLARLVRTARSATEPPFCVHSARSWIQHAWTGIASEDISTASASGLLGLDSGEWDPRTLEALDLDAAALLPLVEPRTRVGGLGKEAGARMGLPSGTPVVAGGGDGFLAALGSGCSTSGRFAITLGTTSGVRRMQSRPEDGSGSGLFCYRYDRGRFLAGAASNNGGNVLDWARRTYGVDAWSPAPADRGRPVFLPFVFGERAPFWDAARAPRWIGVSPSHRPADLGAAAFEGVAFTMAAYARILAAETGDPTSGVLSGNGFHTGGIARILAALVRFPLALPEGHGQATLRGAAMIGFDALGIAIPGGDSGPAPPPIVPLEDPGLPERFATFLAHYR